jgi:hypothetical protein
MGTFDELHNNIVFYMVTKLTNYRYGHEIEVSSFLRSHEEWRGFAMQNLPQIMDTSLDDDGSRYERIMTIIDKIYPIFQSSHRDDCYKLMDNIVIPFINRNGGKLMDSYGEFHSKIYPYIDEDEKKWKSSKQNKANFMKRIDQFIKTL